MKPSTALRDNRNAIGRILTHYPMFSNIRVTGSVDRMEDDDSSDIDLYLDADSTATLLDVVRLQNELEELLLIDVDIFSSNLEIAKYCASANQILSTKAEIND